MEHIVPRWEWRTFGDQVGGADERFASSPPQGSQEGDEVYLLSPAVDANVKIRNQLMDIKSLQQVNADGLEQWKPVLKEAFPLSAALVGQVFDALGIATPQLARAAYTLDQLIAELVEPAGRVRKVAVHKKRVQYRIGGCLAETTELVVDRRGTRTIAIESEDPGCVMAALRELRLDRIENVSYPRGLKRLVGMKG
jgi:exopolyphosphatase/guanosine-5'-triphosphate,3'-diphosphate pyrophosphatase